MFRFLRSLFRRQRHRYLWVWELDETVVRGATFRFQVSERGECLGFVHGERLPEEGRVEFWMRAAPGLAKELASTIPRRAKPEHILLFGAGLLRLLGNTFSTRRAEPGRDLSDEEIEESLLSLLPQVREAMKGEAARQFGLERHEVSVVDGLLEEILVEGKPLLRPKDNRPTSMPRVVGRELTFRMLLLFAPKEVVREFGVLLRKLALREFILLPRSLPLAVLLVKEISKPSGALAFFDEDSTELAFLDSGKLVRNTLVSVGVRSVTNSLTTTLGFGGQAAQDLFMAWQQGNISPSAAERLQKLLNPTYVLLREVLTSSMKAQVSPSRPVSLWILGPGEHIPGLAAFLSGQPLLLSESISPHLPVLPQSLGAFQAHALPLAAAAWFVVTFRETSPWQERFIRALRLLQR